MINRVADWIPIIFFFCEKKNINEKENIIYERKEHGLNINDLAIKSLNKRNEISLWKEKWAKENIILKN